MFLLTAMPLGRAPSSRWPCMLRWGHPRAQPAQAEHLSIEGALVVVCCHAVNARYSSARRRHITSWCLLNTRSESSRRSSASGREPLCARGSRANTRLWPVRAWPRRLGGIDRPSERTLGRRPCTYQCCVSPDRATLRWLARQSRAEPTAPDSPVPRHWRTRRARHRQPSGSTGAVDRCLDSRRSGTRRRSRMLQLSWERILDKPADGLVKILAEGEAEAVVGRLSHDRVMEDVFRIVLGPQLPPPVAHRRAGRVDLEPRQDPRAPDRSHSARTHETGARSRWQPSSVV